MPVVVIPAAIILGILSVIGVASLVLIPIAIVLALGLWASAKFSTAAQRRAERREKAELEDRRSSEAQSHLKSLGNAGTSDLKFEEVGVVIKRKIVDLIKNSELNESHLLWKAMDYQFVTRKQIQQRSQLDREEWDTLVVPSPLTAKMSDLFVEGKRIAVNSGRGDSDVAFTMYGLFSRSPLLNDDLGANATLGCPVLATLVTADSCLHIIRLTEYDGLRIWKQNYDGSNYLTFDMGKVTCFSTYDPKEFVERLPTEVRAAAATAVQTVAERTRTIEADRASSERIVAAEEARKATAIAKLEASLR